MGLICNGPSRGNRVTFTSPRSWLLQWRGLPDTDAAARIAITSYVRAYGPATAKTFDAWLTRGSSRSADVRDWFEAIADELVSVDVEGEACYALASDLDELRETTPTSAVRLLAGFDQYLLGPGTSDPGSSPRSAGGSSARRQDGLPPSSSAAAASSACGNAASVPSTWRCSTRSTQASTERPSRRRPSE